jgi:hypothetical protein
MTVKKQPIKKKDPSAFNISDLKKKIGIDVEGVQDINKSNADKPIEWLVLPKAFEKALQIPGIPMGFISGITGWSDTGKSTIKNCVIAACMKQGVIPVIYETENNFNFEHAIDCGMQATPVYGDVEEVDESTGEVRTVNKIINYEGDFIYFNNNLLCELYGNRDYSNGTEKKEKRKVAVLEDIAYSINTLLDMQDQGGIDRPLCFIWDSIGSIASYRSYISKSGNNMFDAGAISQAFNEIINTRIPASRNIGSPYTNTMFCVNKIWDSSMLTMGKPSIELKGGKSMYYAFRLLIHVGKIIKASTKKEIMEVKGQKIRIGTTSQIETVKNHLPAPWNITRVSEITLVHNGLISPEDLPEYKKKEIPVLLKKLEKLTNQNFSDISEKDIKFETIIDDNIVDSD